MPRRDSQPGRPPPYVTDGAAGGPHTAAAETMLRQLLTSSATPLLTTSCTDALEMAALLSDIHPGDEVIVPSFGFVTTALAFVRAGARIRFADIERDTLGLDPQCVEASVTSSTRAIVPVHYAGIPCRIDDLLTIAGNVGATVIEDAAHALGGSWNGQPLGTFAPLSALSFHATKNFSCGEGGALVVNDAELLSRARIVLEKGTDRRAFLDGQVDKYTWQDLGSSFGLSDFLAERLLSQLEQAATIQARRRSVHEVYTRVLEHHGSTLGYQVPRVPSEAVPAYHLYYVILDEPKLRDPLVRLLQSRGVAATFHFVPLHATPGGRRWGAAGPCPVTERVAASLIRLPMTNETEPSDAEGFAAMFVESLASLL